MISSQRFAARTARMDALLESMSDLEKFLDPYLLDLEEIGKPAFVSPQETMDLKYAKNEEEIAKAVAFRIRTIRCAKGLRQQDLAKLTGIARPNVARLESGRRMPKIGTLRKIAEALHIRFEDLVE